MVSAFDEFTFAVGDRLRLKTFLLNVVCSASEFARGSFLSVVNKYQGTHIGLINISHIVLVRLSSEWQKVVILFTLPDSFFLLRFLENVGVKNEAGS